MTDTPDISPRPASDVPETSHAPQGVLKTDRGNNVAQVLINAFLICVFGFLVYFSTLAIPFHGADLEAFVSRTDLQRVATWPLAQAHLPHEPLALVSLAANYVVGGGSPGVLHAGNLLLHLLNAVLLYLVVRVLLRGEGHELAAALSGFILLVHPSVTQAVNVLVDRAALQGLFFSLLALLAWLHASRDGATRPGGFVAAGALYIAAVASCTLYLIMPLVALAVRPTVARRGATAVGTLAAMVFMAVTLSAAHSLPTAQVLLPTLREAVVDVFAFQATAITPVGNPPHWAAWWAYLIVATVAGALPVVLRLVPVRSIRTGAGVVIGIGILVMAVPTHQHTTRWGLPEERWSGALQDPGARLALAKYHRHEATATGDAEQANLHLHAAARALEHAETGEEHDLLGQILFALDRVDASRTHLLHALTLNPYAREAHVTLARIAENRARRTGDAQALAEAARHYGRADALAPLSPSLRGPYAGILGQQGRHPEAVRELEGLTSDEAPEQLDAMLKHFRAAAHRTTQLRQAALQNPGDATAAAGQAEAALLGGQWQSAYYMLDRFLRQDGSNGNAWELMAVVQAQAKTSDAFVAEWGGAPPATAEAWRSVAARVASAGQWEPAARYLAQATGGAPGDLSVRLELAKTAETIGRVDQAVRILQEAAAGYPESPAPWTRLAAIADAAGNAQSAAQFRAEADRREGVDGPASGVEDSLEAPPAPTRPTLPPRTLIR